MNTIPKDMPLTETAHGTGDRGMAFYIYRNAVYGIQVDARRATHGAPWVHVWTADCVPDQTFKEWDELYLELQSGDGQKPGKYPVLIEVIPRDEKQIGGTCWVCREAWTQAVRVKTGWRRMDATQIVCCDGDLEKVKADPASAIVERLRFVAEGNQQVMPGAANDPE